MSDFLFVFGTLLSGYDHPIAQRLHAEAEFIGPAFCRGRLYLVAHYPGIIESNDTQDRVAGELYRVTDEALMRALDDYEGCGVNDAQPYEFARRLHAVTLDNDDVQAWVYFYNRAADGLPRIASGDFLRHVAEENLVTPRSSSSASG
ncbi:gamma-glutamylcyclotransferase family protein YtfP [Variibacter gotjawalensis]|uniref:Gamma-glutamylcyclotransferase family protein YtfP n=1 Tax=Variibacter gotjawalensis TaxID=1333996 RepID=A0A0S3PP41_9BRAD|nr:gamma-glutamylcyclotransferase family protein [Variibacter gotjawalensis]NIK48012.1 gamma-glutamylcyclotransferase (GGCT)/AIG2-like uncharacterized protein YtfP [Variibacter gotjawalensis]RZS49889.1 gamma-glutamylcyclotransferase (GGCT)/AIG2-like uncharacterized protein YtfP [Variibacter gotjawalensis]BAT57717.1 gamma-glutamylcyclotransferase family protein YtfP [Variibacter gotjawalensis]